ncbi:pyridoxamine 5'-phosphate oxidase family protein [Alicyclobacillus acidiphilus]|uniref:pyridoxamine 5'-phosphate oxidase family protein n=1 Tax=Alicyclobacillus acidiphilus TaxID=182455 RepID=UPI00083190B0|nr:pyridoxamine 5'-phosphate oxidase family protein [Alicyclobacillus acidiphilus]
MFGNLTELPSNLIAFLDGRNLEEKQHEAMLLLTVTEDFWPHCAMLSVGEVVAMDESTLRIAIWPTSTTTANILRTGRATLVVVNDGKAYYIRLALKSGRTSEETKYHLVHFDAMVDGIREDTAKYAELLGGVRFQLNDPSDVIARWNETISDIRRDR